MKTTIAGMLVRNAVEYVQRAHVAYADSRPDEEVRLCIGGHLMIALAIEGIGNEVGEVAFDTWQWSRLEKSDTPLKWYLLSEFGGRTAFEPSKEPLQTVQRLASIRNRIAHPKIEERGDEIIVRNKHGELKRKVSLDHIIEAGDCILVGFGKLIDEFNYKTTLEAVRKGIVAIKMLRQHLNVSGLDWLDEMEVELVRAPLRRLG
jgi:hypothetical protein